MYLAPTMLQLVKNATEGPDFSGKRFDLTFSVQLSARFRNKLMFPLPFPGGIHYFPNFSVLKLHCWHSVA